MTQAPPRSVTETETKRQRSFISSIDLLLLQIESALHYLRDQREQGQR